MCMKTQIPGEQSIAGVKGGLTGNAAVTLTVDMTRRSKPPIAIYSALADATRCRIVEILTTGPVPVHTLADAFSISRPAISRHLRILKTAGLVVEVKKGRENHYTLKSGKLAGAVKWLNATAMREPEVGSAEEIAAPVNVPSASEPATGLQIATPRRPKTKKSEPTEVLGDIVTEPPLFAPKADKSPRTTKSPEVNQMGFDF